MSDEEIIDGHPKAWWDGQHAAYTRVRETVIAKAQRLVELLDDAERYHGSLIGPKTLTAVNELRLELSKWQK